MGTRDHKAVAFSGLRGLVAASSAVVRTRNTIRTLTATVILVAIVPFRLGGQAVDTTAARDALAELDDACDRVGQLWPVPLCGPVVLVDPSSRIAVANRPDPGGRFEAVDDAYAGTLPAEMPIANTSVEWSGERWAMVMLPLRGDRFSRLALLAHESFHRIQPALGHDSRDPLATHLDEEHGRLWLRLELRALARALVLEGAAARTAVSDALLFRVVRHRRYPDASRIEAQLEAHEGVAEYTGVRFALDATGAGVERAAELVARFESRPTYVRSLGYGTGPALGLLLDRYDAGWRHVAGTYRDMARRLATVLDDRAFLDSDAGLEPGDRPLEQLAVERAREYELDVVAAEEGERAVQIAALRERYRAELIDGPVLVLELPERRLMFNPNTVLALGDHGNVYPGAILFGPWGRLTLSDGAALATPDRDRAWVVAPAHYEPDEQGVVAGPGWTLELDPAWHLAPGPRPGDARLIPGPAPPSQVLGFAPTSGALSPADEVDTSAELIERGASALVADGRSVPAGALRRPRPGASRWLPALVLEPRLRAAWLCPGGGERPTPRGPGRRAGDPTVGAACHHLRRGEDPGSAPGAAIRARRRPTRGRAADPVHRRGRGR